VTHGVTTVSRKSGGDRRLTDDQKRFVGLCKVRGMFPLLESVQGRKAWRVYSNTSGVLIGTYYPDGGYLLLAGQDERTPAADDKAAAKLAKSHEKNIGRAG
jgi:hypothetical protein